MWRKAIFFGGMLALNNVFAADWVVIGSSKNSVLVIDKNSIAWSGNNRKAWLSQEYSEAQAADNYSQKSYKSTASLQIFNCLERTMAFKQEILFSENQRAGESIRSNAYTLTAASFAEVVPESLGESALNFVCKFPLKR